MSGYERAPLSKLFFHSKTKIIRRQSPRLVSVRRHRISQRLYFFSFLFFIQLHYGRVDGSAGRHVQKEKQPGNVYKQHLNIYRIKSRVSRLFPPFPLRDYLYPTTTTVCSCRLSLSLSRTTDGKQFPIVFYDRGGYPFCWDVIYERYDICAKSLDMTRLIGRRMASSSRTGVS